MLILVTNCIILAAHHPHPQPHGGMGGGGVAYKPGSYIGSLSESLGIIFFILTFENMPYVYIDGTFSNRVHSTKVQDNFKKNCAE